MISSSRFTRGFLFAFDFDCFSSIFSLLMNGFRRFFLGFDRFQTEKFDIWTGFGFGTLTWSFVFLIFFSFSYNDRSFRWSTVRLILGQQLIVESLFFIMMRRYRRMFSMSGRFRIGIRFVFMFMRWMDMFGIRCGANGWITEEIKWRNTKENEGKCYPSLERVRLLDEWRVSWEDEWDFFLDEDFDLESELWDEKIDFQLTSIDQRWTNLLAIWTT